MRLTGLYTCAVLLCLTTEAYSQAPPLEAGVTKVAITPPVGYRMAGYYRERLNTGTKDPLYAKVIVFRQGEVQVGIIFNDLIGLPGPLVDQARPVIAQATGIPASHLILCATHSHTGPLYFGLYRDHYHQENIKAHGKDPHEAVDYSALLTQAWVQGVKEAQSKLQPVQLKHGATEESRVSFNRRFLMKDGTVRFNPGVNNPQIVKPAGPIDPTVDLIQVQSAKGNPPANLGMLVSFAMHLDTVGGTDYSADYPVHLEKELSTALGDEAICLFGTGTCGDINHVDVTAANRRSAEEIGKLLGETAIAALPKLEVLSEPKLAVARTRYLQDVQKVSEEDITFAKKIFPVGEPGKTPFLDLVRAYTTLDLLQYPDGKMNVEISVVALNDKVAMVFLPGEIFVELGMAIKQESPFEQTLVIELAHDTPFYVPTKRGFLEGSYEIMNSRITPGGGEVMVEHAVSLLKQLSTSTAR